MDGSLDLKGHREVVAMLRDACGEGDEPADLPTDLYYEQLSRQVARQRERLEADLKGYRNNVGKESIR